MKKPPNIYANSNELKPGSKIEAAVNHTEGGRSKPIPLSGKIKIGENVQQEPVSVSYRLINEDGGLQFSILSKTNSDFYANAGAGIQDFPYIFSGIGINKKFFDLGGALMLGSVKNNIYYSGYTKDDDDGRIIEYFDHSKANSNWYPGAYFYASFYMHRFALSYAASASYPVTGEICEDDNSFLCISSFYFDFPALLMQDIGIAYTNNHIKYRIGINQITGVDFPGRYYGTSFQAAWVF